MLTKQLYVMQIVYGLPSVFTQFIFLSKYLEKASTVHENFSKTTNCIHTWVHAILSAFEKITRAY